MANHPWEDVRFWTGEVDFKLDLNPDWREDPRKESDDQSNL
jgi:hypothetical protein